MKPITHPATRAALLGRLDGLQPSSEPRWGKMNAAQMQVHLAHQLQLATGDRKATRIRRVVSLSPIREFAIYWMPWPKGLPTAPELRDPVTGDFSADRVELDRSLSRFLELTERDGLSAHPLFGNISTRSWGTLAARHMDHHLRQFGL